MPLLADMYIYDMVFEKSKVINTWSVCNCTNIIIFRKEKALSNTFIIYLLCPAEHFI